VRQTSQTNRWE